MGPIVAAVMVATAASAWPQSPPPTSAPAPAAHARMLEAYAVADIHRSRSTRIAAVSARQLADPQFRPIANQLAEVLIAHGFNITAPPAPYTQVVTVEYALARDTAGDLPGTGTSDPAGVALGGSAQLPAYRRITVSAYDLSDPKNAKLIWRTAMDDEGFRGGVARTIPPLVAAGAAYYGRSLTPLGAADCSDREAQTGSLIASHPCAAVAAAVAAPHEAHRPEETGRGAPSEPPPGR